MLTEALPDKTVRRLGDRVNSNGVHLVGIATFSTRLADYAAFNNRKPYWISCTIPPDQQDGYADTYEHLVDSFRFESPSSAASSGSFATAAGATGGGTGGGEAPGGPSGSGGLVGDTAAFARNTAQAARMGAEIVNQDRQVTADRLMNDPAYAERMQNTVNRLGESSERVEEHVDHAVESVNNAVQGLGSLLH